MRPSVSHLRSRWVRAYGEVRRPSSRGRWARPSPRRSATRASACSPSRSPPSPGAGTRRNAWFASRSISRSSTVPPSTPRTFWPSRTPRATSTPRSRTPPRPGRRTSRSAAAPRGERIRARRRLRLDTDLGGCPEDRAPHPRRLGRHVLDALLALIPNRSCDTSVGCLSPRGAEDPIAALLRVPRTFTDDESVQGVRSSADPARPSCTAALDQAVAASSPIPTRESRSRPQSGGNPGEPRCCGPSPVLL